MNKTVIVENYYDKNVNGSKGVITDIYNDKDCLYAQGKWANVKLENGTQKVIRTCFLRDYRRMNQ